MPNRAFVEAIEPRVLFSRAYGIDVAHYQGTINWTTLHAQTTPYPVSFAMIKATGSDDGNYTDSQFSNNVTNAAAAGELFGVYHFAEPTSTTYTALQQADFFLSKAKNYMTVGHLPAMLDLEEGGGTLSVAALSTWANTFCQEVYSQTGQKPFIYCNSSYATSYVNTTVSQWPLWIAAYPSNGTNIQTYQPSVGNSTHGWTTWQFWQYSDDNYTPVYANGVGAGVDGDVYKSDAATLFSTYAVTSKVAVTQGSTAVTNGQSTAVNFGTTVNGTTGTSISFTVTNSGNAALTTSGLTVPAGYTVTDPLAGSIAIGASDTLTIKQVTTTNGTFTGNVSFSSNDPVAASFTFPVTSTVYTPDTTAPTLIAANFNWLTTPPTVQFAFSENVGASVNDSDFSVTNTDTNTPVTFSSATFNTSNNVASINFDHPLPDGNYSATVFGNVISDPSGNVLAGSTTVTFFALAGDANHDGVVDIADLGILASSYSATSGKNYSGGDFTGDGAVNIADLGILASNYGKSVAPASSVVASYSPASASPANHKTTSTATVASQVLT